jgi:hypothetical protein
MALEQGDAGMKRAVFSALVLWSAVALSEDAIGIANPGFENGREMWIFETGNVRVVDDVARTGSRSAFIEVKNAMTDGLYIKRHIPITGGGRYTAECFVFGQCLREGVRSAYVRPRRRRIARSRIPDFPQYGKINGNHFNL